MTEESPLRITNPHLICTRETDTSSWNPKMVRFLDYWHSLKPVEGLPQPWVQLSAMAPEETVGGGCSVLDVGFEDFCLFVVGVFD